MAPKLFYTRDRADAAQDYSEWCELLEVETIPSEWGVCLSADGFGLTTPEYAEPFYPSYGRDSDHSELLRACGSGMTVLDAFAGFGTDAVTLAAAGWQVMCVERELLVWLILREGLKPYPDATAVLGDGVAQMQSGTWDVVYLDPMFPARNKRALPNRGLQHLRALASPPEFELVECIGVARAVARNRVVLKRRARDPVVAKPNFQLRGRTIRYDVYLGAASDKTA